MKIKKLSPYRSEYSEGTNVPIVFHLQSSLFPNDLALEQLKSIANTNGIYHHVAVLSDVHPKEGRKCPTGVAVACENFLPQVMDTAPNCGMRMFTLSAKASDLKPEQIDSIFKGLVKAVPTQTMKGVSISHKTVMDICRFGLKGILERKDFPFLKDELNYTFQKGNEFLENEIPSKKDIESVIPGIFRQLASFRLGILGMAGNHFLDLMRVDKIEDPQKAKLMGIEEDQLVFFMHTGSGILGQYSSYFYTPKKEEHLLTKLLVTLGRWSLPATFLSSSEMKELQKQSVSFRHKKEFFTIPPESKTGVAYHLAHRAAANFGFANRSVLTAKTRAVVEKELGKKINWHLIYDMPHIGVRKEKHFDREVWIHRNGVSRAFGPSKMSGHEVFSKTGEPCFFAGSMTTPSYLAVAQDSNSSTFFSASHGAGKKKEAPEKFSKEELFQKVQKDGVKLYNAKSRGVVKQYSDYYKNINEVMEGIEQNNIAKPVARLVPIAVLMA